MIYISVYKLLSKPFILVAIYFITIYATSSHLFFFVGAINYSGYSGHLNSPIKTFG